MFEKIKQISAPLFLALITEVSFVCLIFASISMAVPSEVPNVQSDTYDQTRINAQKAADKLLKKAKSEQKKGNFEDAANAYYDFYLQGFDVEQAEDALWQAAQLRKKMTSVLPDADWEQVKDLFRRYINYYPKSNRVPEAYLELGVAYFHMHFYREALSYVKLFIKTYPMSPLVTRAKMWQGKTLVKVGRQVEAEKIFQTLLQSKDVKVRLIGKKRMGELRYVQGRYRESKDYWQSILLSYPDHYLADPDVLRSAGLVDIKLGKMERGRRELYHYLNLETNNIKRMAVLAELADSYYQAEDYQTARQLFGQVIKNGTPDDRAVLLAKLRMALYKDGSAFKASRWDKPQDLANVQGDKPYQDVLDRNFKDFMAQDARYGLFMRYKARNELTAAYDIGRAFLRNSADYEDGTSESKKVGDVLLYLVKEFLGKRQYQKIYDLYFIDYRHVKDFPDGRLLYMVGQAMEGLHLYGQASIVYYRALNLPLPDAEKTDLYLRRARVYLLNKDYTAADRLLTYLRKLYKSTETIAAVYFYSGGLAEAKGDKVGAFKFYQLAVTAPGSVKRMSEYAGDAIRMALVLGDNDRAYEVWEKAWQSGGFPAVLAQGLGLKIANAFRGSVLWGKAALVYKATLADDFPQDGKIAQLCALYYGDSLFFLGRKEEGIVYYKKAQVGKNEMIAKLAAERLQQDDISTQLTEMKKTLAY